VAAAVALAVPAVVLAVVLLGSPEADGRRPNSPAAERTPEGRATPTPTAAMVLVPDTVGMSEAEAQAAAQAVGLAWRIEWRIVPGQDPRIYRQDPKPGTLVRAGSPFVMQAYRQR
jgi:hypothetical protein